MNRIFVFGASNEEKETFNLVFKDYDVQLHFFRDDKSVVDTFIKQYSVIYKNYFSLVFINVQSHNYEYVFESIKFSCSMDDTPIIVYGDEICGANMNLMIEYGVDNMIVKDELFSIFLSSYYRIYFSENLRWNANRVQLAYINGFTHFQYAYPIMLHLN